MSVNRADRRLSRFAIRVRKRNVLITGFGVVIILLLFSTTEAYEIQGSLSNEAVEIYHSHVNQDDILFQLRRALWQGANSARDFLLDPSGNRVARFRARIDGHRRESQRSLDDLDRLPKPTQSSSRLRAKINEFWSSLEQIPALTENLNAEGQYDFVQREIVPRRNAVGEVVYQFTEINQNALKESEAEFARTRRSAAQRLFLILGLCVIFGMAVAGFSLAHSESLERQTARQYEEVAQAKSELQQLSTRLMEIQEEERTRLSRELHDEIGQTLATLRLEISRAESLPNKRLPEIRERLASARVLAEKTVQTVRDICSLLRPTLLDDLGLGPALQWQVEEFTRRTGVACAFDEEGLEDALPEAVRTCVYRVLQESLHNCEKHAGATTASVSIRQASGVVTIRIEDNGCGFELEPKGARQRAARFGLLGMRERAAALGGALDVNSAPGAGTRLVLRLPVTRVSTASEKPASPAEVGV
jgi:signal transduction histidine kinase